MSPRTDLATYCETRTYVSPLHVARLASDARVSAYVAALLAEDEADAARLVAEHAATEDGATDEAEGKAWRDARNAHRKAKAVLIDAWNALTVGERMELEANGFGRY